MPIKADMKQLQKQKVNALKAANAVQAQAQGSHILPQVAQVVAPPAPNVAVSAKSGAVVQPAQSVAQVKPAVSQKAKPAVAPGMSIVKPKPAVSQSSQPQVAIAQRQDPVNLPKGHGGVAYRPYYAQPIYPQPQPPGYVAPRRMFGPKRPWPRLQIAPAQVIAQLPQGQGVRAAPAIPHGQVAVAIAQPQVLIPQGQGGVAYRAQRPGLAVSPPQVVNLPQGQGPQQVPGRYPQRKRKQTVLTNYAIRGGPKQTKKGRRRNRPIPAPGPYRPGRSISRPPISRPPISISQNVVVSRPPVIANPVQVNQHTSLQGCPPGFFTMDQIQEVKKKGHGPLFKYAYIGDLITDLDIKKHIYIRVTKSLIECILLQGVRDFEVRVLAFLLNHVEGQLLVNTPLPEDSHKLKHILDVKKDTKTEDVARAIFKEIETYPLHFVLYSDFNITGSAIMPKIVSKNTTARLLEAYSKQS